MYVCIMYKVRNKKSQTKKDVKLKEIVNFIVCSTLYKYILNSTYEI